MRGENVEKKKRRCDYFRSNDNEPATADNTHVINEMCTVLGKMRKYLLLFQDPTETGQKTVDTKRETIDREERTMTALIRTIQSEEMTVSADETVFTRLLEAVIRRQLNTQLKGTPV